jgi:pimeloyl-ACP methyl ester carboxylesterase
VGFFHHKHLLTVAALSLAGACTVSPNGESSTESTGAEPSEASASSRLTEAAAPAAVANGTDGATSSEELDSQRISFSPCPEDPELRCSSLSVPIDHARPSGPRIDLAVAKAPSLAPSKKGFIFVNPGGPGGSGVDFILRAKPLWAALRTAGFDIVSFDPRGTARSSPVACTIQLPPPPAGDELPPLAAFLDHASGLLAQACAEQNGALAAKIGTNDVARDMDRLRAALGERELNYLGFSYGTILGASYATLFPQRVRAMVLDANVTPVWLGDYLLELDGEGSTGAEVTLRRLDALCRADAACPLRTAGVIATLDRVAARLDANPVFVDGGVIDGSVVRGQTFGMLYNERQGWQLITQILAMADAGDLRGLQPAPLDPGNELSVEATLPIICNDSRTRRPALDYLPPQLEQRALTPRFGGVNLGIAITACTRWPVTPVIPLANSRTRHEIVMIGNDYDPATPLSWSRNMATALGSPTTLVRYRGGGHTIYGSGSACVDGAVHAYFRDPEVTPVRLTCPAVPISLAPRPLPPLLQQLAQRRAAKRSSARSSAAPNLPPPSSIAEVLEEVTPAPARGRRLGAERPADRR